jgi:hypothetical protein
MICKGLKLTPVIGAGGEVESWEVENVDVDVGDECQECCDRPRYPMEVGAEFPVLTCGDGCHLHTRGDPALGQVVEAWCCKD